MTRPLWIAAPAAALTVRNLLVPIEQIVGRVPDDAVFYLVFARNLAAGRGFTFDGVDAGTGFHPLWLAIVSLLPEGSPEAGLRGLLGLHGLVTVVTALVLDSVLRAARVRRAPSAVLAAAAGAWGATTYGLGMETGLVALLGLAAVRVGLGGPGAGLAGPVAGRAGFGVGLLLGLARIDALPLLLGAGRSAPHAFAGGAVGVGATLLFNRAVTGEWASTSARLKGLGTVGERLARLDPETVWRHAPAPAVLALGLIALAAWKARRVAPAPLLLGAAGGLAWLTTSYLLNNLVGPWYHLPLAWLLVATAAAAAGSMRGTTGVVALGVLVVGLVRGAGLPGEGLHTTVVGAARAARDATATDARIVAEDFPGLLAWFAERDVLPADGLAAGPGYREALLAGDALAWWTGRGATHWMVTRRRAPWAAERPLVDRIAPPFLPVPATPVPLDADSACFARVDAASGRLFALYAFPAGSGGCGGS